ncbi:hypothetical protein [Mycobacterium sp. 852002-51152_SCH6134967]|uniref:hypothetical protein n=1 Tax=Mycobacterium sp. 852002-51152_SCH6134967 TaxID=1834096 RepID=UPI0012E85432|nr:hypothetical protein [Mycobacterium sp. 852002-51152_SCH6134967]
MNYGETFRLNEAPISGTDERPQLRQRRIHSSAEELIDSPASQRHCAFRVQSAGDVC